MSDDELLENQAQAARCGLMLDEYLVSLQWAMLPWEKLKPRQTRASRVRRGR